MEMDIRSAGFEIAVIIVGVVLVFYAYHYSAHSKKLEQYIIGRFPEGTADLALFFYRKLAGFIILGVIPGILYFKFLGASREKFGITLNHLESSFMLIAGLILVTGIVLFFHHRGNPERSTLQLRPPEWNVSMFMLNALGWSMYLIAYEFLFRGILLFESYEALGFWPAVAINIALYSAVHMVSGKDQTIGALIFGSIACYFALSRGTLLIPIFMHLSLSILSNYYSIRNQQSIKLAHSKFGKNKR